MATYRDKRTGSLVSEETFNRSSAQGGGKYFEKVSESDVIFRSIEDLYFNPDDYDEYEYLEFDGGADYGSEE